MVTILIFSLVFAHTRLIRRDLGDYKCHVENASETAGHIRSLDVFLQAPGIAATKGKLSRHQKVSTLECFSHRSSVQVNLLHLEKLHGDLAERAVKKCTLQSIEVITTAVRAPARNHSCVLLTPKRRKFHRKFVLRGKVFLPGVSSRAVKAMLLKQKVFSEAPTIPPVYHRNQTSQEGITPRNDRDFMIRKKISIIIKLLIVCVLLVSAICYIVTVICEFPCSAAGCTVLAVLVLGLDGRQAEQQQKRVHSLRASGSPNRHASNPATYGHEREIAAMFCLTLRLPSTDRSIIARPLNEEIPNPCCP